jgi:hypothetical protein
MGQIMAKIMEILTFWNIMGSLGVMLTVLVAAIAAYGMAQGLAEGWRESFPDGFRWPWQPRPTKGDSPRIYRVKGLDDPGLDG